MENTDNSVVVEILPANLQKALLFYIIDYKTTLKLILPFCTFNIDTMASDMDLYRALYWNINKLTAIPLSLLRGRGGDGVDPRHNLNSSFNLKKVKIKKS